MKKSQARFLFVSVILTIITTSCQLPFGEQPSCGQSMLQIGDRTYQIKAIETKPGGSLKIPANEPEIAYWVNQTEINQVFALSSTTENLALQNTNPEQATVTWENCNSSTYTLSAPQSGLADMNTLLDQSFSGITIFVQSSNSGFMIRGEFIGEEIQAFDTPDPSEALAEISLLETTPSANKATITVSVSIVNYGQTTITLSSNDVAFLVGGSASAPLNSEPALPKEIATGDTETFLFTFSYPAAPGATIKVLGAEYELEY